MTATQVKDYILERGLEDVIVMDEFASAFVGLTYDGHACYDFDLMVEALVTEQGMSEEEALDWLDYNTLRAIPYMASEGLIPVVIHRVEE